MKNPPKYEVLVAEDDSLILKLELRNLKKLVICPVKSFWHGGELITYLKETANAEEPKLIFLDINMPRVDGWDVLDFIEDFEFKDSLYVIILSASIYSPDEERALRYSRVVGYYDKFLDTHELSEILKQETLMQRFKFVLRDLKENAHESQDQTIDLIS